MLEFNPGFRPEASELLKNKVFDRIRNAELEREAPFKISLEVDENGIFDYENCQSLKYNLKDLKEILKQEIKII